MAIYDIREPEKTNFISAAQDLQSIIEKFANNMNILKLLKYTTPNALSMPDLSIKEKREVINKGIKVIPRLPIEEEGMASYIVITFDYFKPNLNNPYYRDNYIIIDVICQMDYWKMDDYMLRPYKIMHEIDSMLSEQKLNGIGRVEFAEATTLIINDKYAGYTLRYRVINDK